MQATREFFVQTLGIEAWLAMVLAIVLLALVASQVAHLLFNQLTNWPLARVPLGTRRWWPQREARPAW